MATAQEQLDALKASLRSGRLTVSYDGRSVTHRSAEEMRSIIASLERELGITTTPMSAVVRSSKGW